MQSVLFKNLAKRPVSVAFDSEQSSSDGGAVLLQAVDNLLGLTATLAACLGEQRQAGKIAHSLTEMLRQRVFGIACGYEDCNDAARLGADPLFKVLLGRDPERGRDLASQPTLSRFENGVGAGELLAMGEAFARCVLERQRERRGTARMIEIDFDPTCDPTHGQQQLSLFNGFYDTSCYLPLVGFARFDNEREQYLVAAVLRSGTAAAGQGLLPVLKRLLPQLREMFPRAQVRIRLDAGFQGEELLAYLEGQDLEYTVCLASNAVLQRLAEPLQAALRSRGEAPAGAATAAAEGGRAATGDAESAAGQRLRLEAVRARLRPAAEVPQVLYGQGRYRASTWSRERRVIFKCERTECPGREPKDNPRFVLTSIGGAEERIYRRVYCRRGDVENRIKELKRGLQMDRTSCTSFLANQLRVLLAAAAYALLQELRWQARKAPAFARRQVDGLRLGLLKLGARIQATTRRIVLHLPRVAPYRAEWLEVACGLGAVPT